MGRGLEALFGLKALVPEIKHLLQEPVRLLPGPRFPSQPDWKLIHWKYLTAQAFRDHFGFYIDIGYKRGDVERARLVWREGGIDLIPAGFSDRKKEEEERWKRKLERARRRLSRLPECGKRGHVLAVMKVGDEIEARYHPHRCHSVLCPYCAYENFRETFGKHYEVFEQWHKANKRLAFWTLTIRSFESPREAVEFSFKALEKLYQLRVGKRNWEKIRQAFVREALSYYRALKESGDEKARAKTRKQLRYFRRFEAQIKPHLSQGIKFGQLFNAMWKFEITYTANGWHPHWHGIVDGYIPKLLLTVVWRMATDNLGEITDVRKVSRGKKGLLELTKYITKHWELGGVPFEKLVELEASLFGRKKFRVWGFEILELEEEEEREEEVFFLWQLRCELKTRQNLRDVPRLVRLLRRKRLREIFFDRLVIYDERHGVWEVDLFLRHDGKLVVKDEEFLEVLYGYCDEIAVMGCLDDEVW